MGWYDGKVRRVRDLSCGDTRIFLELEVRRLDCLRDRRALARYAGLTGSPDESGLKSREKGLAKAGNARVYDVG
jgi:transposase